MFAGVFVTLLCCALIFFFYFILRKVTSGELHVVEKNVAVLGIFGALCLGLLLFLSALATWAFLYRRTIEVTQTNVHVVSRRFFVKKEWTDPISIFNSVELYSELPGFKASRYFYRITLKSAQSDKSIMLVHLPWGQVSFDGDSPAIHTKERAHLLTKLLSQRLHIPAEARFTDGSVRPLTFDR